MFRGILLNCQDEGRLAKDRHYSNPQVNIIEVRNPNSVVSEMLGLNGEIQLPKVYSPKEQFRTCERSRIPAKQCVVNVLNGLQTAEKVARRQYDELLMFPELTGFEAAILEIRNDEYEHEEILECIIKKVQAGQTTTEGISETATVTVGGPLETLYMPLLKRCKIDTEQTIRDYEQFLSKIQETTPNTDERGLAVVELKRKINRILQETRTHQDTIDAMETMIKGI